MIRSTQNSFVNGEISPAIYGRHDLKAYFQGAALIKNFVVRRAGGIVKRPGTDFTLLDEGYLATEHPEHTRVIPFFYDNTTAYLIFLTGPKAFFFDCATHDWQLNAAKTAPLGGLDLGELTGTVPNQVWVGLTATGLPTLRWKQAGDTVFLTGPGLLPTRIVRQADTTWKYLDEPQSVEPSSTVTLSTTTAGHQGRLLHTTYAIFEEKNGRRSLRAQKEAPTYTPWAEGATVTLTVGLPAGSADSFFLVAKRTGRESKPGTTWGIIGDVEYAAGGTTFVDSNYVAHENIYPQKTIRDMDAGGYSLLDFYQQRTILAGNNTSPFRLWFSKLSDLYTWYANRPADDSDPFAATLPAVRASGIKHLISGKRLVLLTEDGAFVIHSDGEGFTYRSIKIERATNIPCSDALPFATTTGAIYVAAGGRRLIEMVYEWANDGFQTVDRSVLADHLTEAAAIQTIAYQEEPDSTLWVLRTDGKLLSFTYMPEHEVFAWAQHELVPPFQYTSFRILTIIGTDAIDATTTGRAATSQMYALCLWTDPCSLVEHNCGLLKMRSGSIADTNPSDALDFRQTIVVAAGHTEVYSAAAGSVWRKSTDAAWTPVAANTDIDLVGGTLGATYIVGTPVRARLETLRPETPDHNIQGIRKNVMDTVIRVRRCGALKISRPGETAVDAMPASGLTTGDFKTIPRGRWNTDGRLVIESLDTSPAEILSVITTLRLDDLDKNKEDSQ